MRLDGHTLVGAAERGCVTALSQWHALLSERIKWHAREAWVLPVMALRALSTRKGPAALAVLQWVFRTATRQVGSSTSRLQLPPLLLTVLAFKCASIGDFDTFRWLYADGRQLTKQDIQAQVSVAGLKAFKQAMGPFGGADKGVLPFMRVKNAAVTYTLMDTALGYGQGEFVTLLSRSAVGAPLATLTHLSAVLAAHSGSRSLLQWLHAHTGCTFNNSKVIAQCLKTRSGPRPWSGDEAIAHNALDALKWLRDIGAFQARTQTDLTDMIVSTAEYHATRPHVAYPVRLQWLLREMGAEWPDGGAARIVRAVAHDRQAPD
ncbi:hypothetical protein JKP88DRAFT_278467 [Tribonema minus]|uniref:Uncharacterized protein n=1 Tax=Tribonema minus TaxID=303371 RepID=A0A835Z490_9STRA|nr:hypothetical protein JKP88DRAFT_278467 [Tribonema minus]